MKMARMTKMSIPYIPAPTPPKITSPVWMLNSGTSPPRGVKLSCMELTAPQEASVVIVAKMPKRTSLPSILPAAALTPIEARRGFPAASAGHATSTPAMKRTNIAIQTVQPCA